MASLKNRKKIVMKSRYDREKKPKADWHMGLPRDILIERCVSDCCKSKLIRIAGSLRCSKCDKYCKAVEKCR